MGVIRIVVLLGLVLFLGKWIAWQFSNKDEREADFRPFRWDPVTGLGTPNYPKSKPFPFSQIVDKLTLDCSVSFVPELAMSGRHQRLIVMVDVGYLYTI
jgi:hypothetical protein